MSKDTAMVAASEQCDAGARGGFAFALAHEQGVTWLEISTPLLADMHVRVSGWEQGLRWQQRQDGVWHESHADAGFPLLQLCDFDLVARIRAGDRSAAAPLETFFARFPPEVLSLARPFCWRQGVVLGVLAESPVEATQMLHDNPALLWLTVDTLAARELPRKTIHEWLRLPRVELLGHICDVEVYPRTVRLLSRIRFDATRYTEQKCRALRALVANEAMVRVLGRWPRLPENVVRWADRAPNVMCLPLCRDFYDDPAVHTDGSRMRRLLLRADLMVRECRVWGAQMWLSDIEPRLRSLRTLEQLHALHRRLNERHHESRDIIRLQRQLGHRPLTPRALASMGNRAVTRLHNRLAADMRAIEQLDYLDQIELRHGTTTFPEPPLPGTPDIRPITTAAHLQAEGRCMSHCVGSYVDEVMSGSTYIYQVLKPERATLELKIDATGVHRGMIRRAHNQRVSERTIEVVERWLSAARGAGGGR